MNFLDTSFLRTHSQQILAFYDDRVIDSAGGYFQNFYDDGTTFNQGFKQLVSSTRIIVNYATAAMTFNQANYLTIAQHGLNFLEQVHWQEASKGYAWTLQDNSPLDMTQQAYGYAFVLLAYAAVRKAGIISSDDKLDETYQLLEERFWQADYGLYADTLHDDGVLSDYRGQNANMHSCEATIAAFEATGEQKFLDKAYQLALNFFTTTNYTPGYIHQIGLKEIKRMEYGVIGWLPLKKWHLLFATRQVLGQQSMMPTIYQ